MQITIGKKDLGLNFGVHFVREIDKLVGVEMNIQGSKQSLGFGLTKAVLGLKSYDSLCCQPSFMRLLGIIRSAHLNLTWTTSWMIPRPILKNYSMM